ncbi:MAG: LacI family DNA-binding transcriptional regulator [Chloroflexota bacterium]|nr:LacI family DNA-binding transcriptional regulator [Chloroflexota bacterium]
MKSRPTIIDVAERAGVSKSTVSRVVADDGQGVSDRARERVQKAIEELGYVPNAVASSLRTARTNIIMLTIPDIANPFWPDLARGVQDVMDEEGYAVVFANSDWDGQREATFLQMAGRNRLDGILINPIQVSNEELKATGIPTVVISSSERYPDFDAVGSDSFGAAQQALAHLTVLGHRRIGLIRGRRVHRLQHSRLAGYLHYLHEHGLPIDENLIVEVTFDETGGFQAMEQLLALPCPPTAVFASNDLLAIGALHAAHAAGLQVPRDLSIVGLDGIFAASTTIPPLTTVAKPKEVIGRRAACLLLERIRRLAPSTPRREIVACHLQERGSTALPGARRSDQGGLSSVTRSLRQVR